MITNEEPKSPQSYKKGIGKKKHGKLGPDQLKEFVQSTFLPLYTLMKNTVTTRNTGSSIKENSTVMGPQWENSL